MKLLKQLCSIHAPSGSEKAMKDFLLEYIKGHKSKWKNQPEIITGPDFQDCIVLVFGEPRTAIFAHMDSIGYTVKYDREVVKIGGPSTKPGTVVIGEDSRDKIECKLRELKDKTIKYTYKRSIDRGTTLTFKPNFRETEDHVQCCYLDNRLGVWSALQVAETLENGIICFSTYEEHGGGSVGFLARFIYEHYHLRQALISDITWVTEGIRHGKGVAVSMRDSGIPRRGYIEKVIGVAEASGIPFQLEVEGAGGSDGNQLQASPYPFDWCFVGAPEDNVHSPDEIVHKKDIEAMVAMYEVLMKEL